MDAIFITVGTRGFTLGEVLVAGLALVALMFAAVLWSLWRAGRERALETVAQLEKAGAADARIAELTGRLQAFAEALASRQSDLGRTVSERLDQVGQRVGEGLSTGARATAEQLSRLEARLSVIDAARENIVQLADQVTGLKAILANKPARGAFGQGRMEAIVRDALPASAYAFQATLPNGSRPDCTVTLPGDDRPLVIDAKFPLEAFEQLRLAAGPEAEKAAEARVRSDVGRHVKDVAEKYVVHGDTQDVALLFVPSEALYAEINERFEDVVQRAHRARVLIVSPSLLMLAIQVVQGLVRDAAMREQAHLIQDEVRRMIEDVSRLTERTRKLATHFAQAEQDLNDIEISAGKIMKRGSRLEQMEFSAASPRPEALPNPLARGEAAE